MIKAVGVSLVYAWLLWRGYQRRRGVWDAGSWWRFGALVGAGIVLQVVALAMATGVDNGVYARLSPLGDRLYFFTLMALMIIAPAALVALVFWFALGRPDRQLGQGGIRATERSLTSVAHQSTDIGNT